MLFINEKKNVDKNNKIIANNEKLNNLYSSIFLPNQTNNKLEQIVARA
jgi:hypothetical protein